MSLGLGVSQKDGGWVWTCGCGAAGEPNTDRDVTRESFKQHRRKCTVVGKIDKEPQPTKAQGGQSTMSTKKGSSKTKTSNKARERAVSEKEALAIIEKLKANKSSVMAEARRLGCYHATLRKALRAAVGDSAYTKLIEKKKAQGKTKAKAAKPATKASKKTTPRKRAATPKAAPSEPAPESTTQAEEVVAQ